MRAVLYTLQMEPITVVDIPMWLWQRLEDGDTIAVPTKIRPPLGANINEGRMSQSYRFDIVHIFAEPIVRKRHRSLMLFTRNEEHALRLQADFLPGQRAELQSRERDAFGRGFVEALSMMLPPGGV